MHDSTPIRIREIDHIVLRTRAVERLLAFYRDTLGCTIERIQPEIGLTQLRAGRCLIDLLDMEPPRNQSVSMEAGIDAARNMDHFCLRIEPFDAVAISAFLRERGYEPGRVETRYGAEGEGPSIYVADPDGNTVELKGPPATPADED